MAVKNDHSFVQLQSNDVQQVLWRTVLLVEIVYYLEVLKRGQRGITWWCEVTPHDNRHLSHLVFYAKRLKALPRFLLLVITTYAHYQLAAVRNRIQTRFLLYSGDIYRSHFPNYVCSTCRFRLWHPQWRIDVKKILVILFYAWKNFLACLTRSQNSFHLTVIYCSLYRFSMDYGYFSSRVYTHPTWINPGLDNCQHARVILYF